MPWKETSVFEQRVCFIHEFLTRSASIAELCRRFGISRPTAYKYIARYDAFGFDGLRDLHKSPRSHPNATPDNVVEVVLALRNLYSPWGARKLKAILERDFPRKGGWPCESTIGAILRNYGFSDPPRSRAHTYAKPTGRTESEFPCHVLTADFKGQFKLGDGRWCYPLTIVDNYSCSILRCQGLYNPCYEQSLPVWVSLFQEFGLPQVIRTDNGAPFAGTGLAGLSKLSIWWIKLGITHERIAPGSPQQNGRHERMHRELKKATATPPKRNLYEQQQAFDQFVHDYNTVRPHEGLDMATPSSLFTPSSRTYASAVPAYHYAPGTIVRRVRTDGSVKWRGRWLYVSETLCKEEIGLTPVDDRHYALYLAETPIAILDDYTSTWLHYQVASPILDRLSEEC